MLVLAHAPTTYVRLGHTTWEDPAMTMTLDHRPAPPLRHLQRPRAARRATSPATWERNGDRRDRVHLALSELFAARNDLGGVSVVADVLSEDLLWSV